MPGAVDPGTGLPFTGLMTGEVSFVSDSALIVRVSAPGDVPAWSEHLQDLARVFPITNLHPALNSIVAEFEPHLCDPLALKRAVEAGVPAAQMRRPAHESEIPVHFAGPDLNEIAEHAGVTRDELIRLLCERVYTVAFLGFAPGFPYLTGLPEELLNVPRKRVPRVRVPAGSVAIAGGFAGIYPNESPGGWQIAGTTPRWLFDPRRAPASALKPGDRVRFVRADHAAAAGALKPAGAHGTPVLEVLNGGFQTTVQDRGRDGYTGIGVSPGGAADALAFHIANRLVGNIETAAALEFTATGGTYRFLLDTWIAVTGAPAEVRLDGRELEMWRAQPVYAGQTLEIGAVSLRCYLSVCNGFASERLLGSRSTLLSAGWGGPFGRALRSGDRLSLSVDNAGRAPVTPAALVMRSLYEEPVTELRVTRGPQWTWFSEEAHAALVGDAFSASAEVNRQGVRFTGPPLELKPERRGQELVSEGIANGALQVASGGQLMALFCEQRTTGGYPKIANLIRADLYRLGQIAPGTRLRFRIVEIEDAWRLNREYECLKERL